MLKHFGPIVGMLGLGLAMLIAVEAAGIAVRALCDLAAWAWGRSARPAPGLQPGEGTHA